MPDTEPTPDVIPENDFWSDLKNTFRGVPRDFTKGSIGRAIILLAIPMVLEMLMQSIFGVVDVFFVSRLGADAVAAVGMTDSLMVLVYAVGMGLSIAATAMVARRIGENKPKEASIASFQALIAGFIASIPIAIGGILFAPELMGLMGASESVIEIGSTYCAILLGSNVLILYLFLINAIFRGAGDAILAMRVLWLANIINIFLDPALIFGWGPFPEMGVTGAAVATSIGRGIGVLFQLYILIWGSGKVKLFLNKLKFDRDMMRRLVKISWPAMIQYGVATASWMILFRIIAMFGSTAMAGYTIAIRIIIFALLPSWGMGNAAATLVGQNLGAKQPDRAERSVWITAYWNMAFLGTVALFMYIFADELMRIFTEDAGIIAVGVSCLRIVSVTYIFFAFGMVSVQAFNGAGDTRTPTIINLISYWVFQIPLAYLLAKPLGFGANGAFIAIAVAQTILALISMIWFRKGTWKTKVI
ncbi:MAG: MATE family efflux transporter [Rhodothermales bacterium]